MKLLMCSKCNEIFNLDYSIKSCKCGLTKGSYLSDAESKKHGIAEYTEYGIPIVIKNNSLFQAINENSEFQDGKTIICFVASKESIYFRKNSNL
jgi:hypothetical protein